MNSQTTTAPTQRPMTRRDLEARMIAKAWREPGFKTLLLTDPKTALQHELSAIDPSITLPAALQVQVHEEAPNTYHLVLPRNPRDISLGEVVGDDLEAVAPQTIAVLLIAVVAGNTVVAGNNVAVVNAVTAGNVAVTGNVAANANALGNVNTI
jgi:hypothetical protein